ncbi:hypothetical protein T265_03553 [Opisthorchis viverrini]|uniref:Uncharacterized protein n=1 Tax=Opisthorchis viverrini TaxID=6198 RepID=A0A074ZVQ1_OPIVI|nr:hypothetical protein T265_03553 [Opisthorchis viverrini]KER29967.1 hypothetical protein T265_03553 [Opisthorchis viverrini]
MTHPHVGGLDKKSTYLPTHPACRMHALRLVSSRLKQLAYGPDVALFTIWANGHRDRPARRCNG